MNINLEMIPALHLSFAHHLDICVFHVEILESHSEMEILKREGNFDQILKREIKMRDDPFQLKISKEDSDFRPLPISGAKTKVPIKPFFKVGCHFRVKRYRG